MAAVLICLLVPRVATKPPPFSLPPPLFLYFHPVLRTHFQHYQVADFQLSISLMSQHANTTALEVWACRSDGTGCLSASQLISFLADPSAYAAAQKAGQRGWLGLWASFRQSAKTEIMTVDGTGLQLTSPHVFASWFTRLRCLPPFSCFVLMRARRVQRGG